MRTRDQAQIFLDPVIGTVGVARDHGWEILVVEFLARRPLPSPIGLLTEIINGAGGEDSRADDNEDSQELDIVECRLLRSKQETERDQRHNAAERAKKTGPTSPS